MKQKQVLILYENPLFAEGLVSILRRERGLKIENSVSRMGNELTLIKTLRPDVVIIEGGNPTVDAGSVLRELLKHSSNPRVISVNLNRKNAVVYYGLQLVATKSNLIKAVKNQGYGGTFRVIGKENRDEGIRKGKAL